MIVIIIVRRTKLVGVEFTQVFIMGVGEYKREGR